MKQRPDAHYRCRPSPAPACGAPRRRAPGFSLVEMLVSLAIVSVLLTATVVALDASFQAYAAAAESASTHTSSRLISHRLLTLVRTSTAHGPLYAQTPGDGDWTAMIAKLNEARTAAGLDAAPSPTLTATPQGVESSYLRLIDSDGNDVVVMYLPDTEELWVLSVAYDDSTSVTAQPLIGGVTQARFTTRRRIDESGVPVLERGSMIIEIQPSVDTSLAIEAGDTPPIQIIASTAPRKLLPR